jgi:uncharacterized LabA/DUF88 family protein
MDTVPDVLSGERAAIFIDYDNTRHALRRAGQQVDLMALKDYLSEGRHVVETFVYLATRPQPEFRDDDRALLHRLQSHGFLIRTQEGQLLPDGRLKCNLDLEMALDVQEFTARTRLDIAVLVTGKGSLAPLVERLRCRGIRTEVASTEESASHALRTMANGFVDLTHIGNGIENLVLPEDEEALEPQAPLAAEAPLPEDDGAFEEVYLDD